MLKPYDEYISVETKWAQQIPSHWEIQRLKKVLIERKEKNNPIQTDFILSLSAKYGVLPYTERRTSGNKSKSDLFSYAVAREGDLIVNCMNVIIGSSGVTKWDGAISPVYYAFYPKCDDINIHYISYIFRLPTFYRDLRRFGKGILEIRLRVSINDLNNISITLPPRDEQDQIVRYLDWKVSQVNKLINAKKKQIALLQEQKQAIINEELDKINADFVRCRYLGSFQNGISEAGDFFTDGFPFVNYGDVYNNITLPTTVSGRAKSNKKQQSIYSVQEGDIFFTRTSETIDEVGLTSVCFNTIDQAVFSGFVIRMRPEKGLLDNSYTKYYFRSQRVRNYFIKEMNLVTRASLGQTLLKDLPVLLPSVDVQRTVGRRLDIRCENIDALIALVQHQITLFAEYRTRLISDVVTGQIDVRDVEIPEYEAAEEIIEDNDLSDDEILETEE